MMISALTPLFARSSVSQLQHPAASPAHPRLQTDEVRFGQTAVKENKLVVSGTVNGDVIFEGDIVLENAGVEGKIVSKQGSVTLKGSSHAGDITAKGDVFIDAGSSVKMIDTEGSLIVKSEPWFLLGIYATMGKITAKGDVTLGYGSRTGGIEAGGSVTLQPTTSGGRKTKVGDILANGTVSIAEDTKVGKIVTKGLAGVVRGETSGPITCEKPTVPTQELHDTNAPDMIS